LNSIAFIFTLQQSRIHKPAGNAGSKAVS